MPQWKKVVASAALPASGVPASTPKRGAGSPRWKIGSATDQNIRPMPMPALSSIAYQAGRLNSGLAAGPPMRILPVRLNAKYAAANTNRFAARM